MYELKQFYFLLLFFSCLSLVYGQSYVESEISQTPEDELCNWLVAHCPYLASKRRPVEEIATPVPVTRFDVVARRFIEIQDLNQLLVLRAVIHFEWKLPPCAVWSEDLLKDVTELSAEAKRVTQCDYSIQEIWKPLVRLRNSYEDQFSIQK